ncbi:MAG: GntR family transcriptional regulator [Bacteroidales bacterium]
MNFTENKAIYLQIADYVCEQILTKKWNIGDRAMSVRELGISLEVNPNTVLRSYDFLQSLEVIVNKRGVGFFVTPYAIEKIIVHRKQQFIQEELPVLFKNMELIQINIQELEQLYRNWKEKSHHSME